ncbi:MAG: serine hydroxymethyltransferase [Planctomycetota bacterium]
MLDLLEKIPSQEYHEGIFSALKAQDRQIYELITKEYERLHNNLQLIAAENQCSRAVLAALGSVVQNKTTEGFPGARYHGGCEFVDDLERLAEARAKEAFGAQYANVQPHSGTGANQIVLTALLERGDKILSLGLDQGGHLSHGARISFSGQFFDVDNYYVDQETFLLDYDAIRDKAVTFRPKLIICGASAYSRVIDFQKFRRIADEVGAYLLADISHIAGLVIAGAHQSPIDHAHFTTTSTYKPGGPRGGLILMGKDYDRKIKVRGKDITLWEHIQKTTFPGVQGTPYLNNVAAKAIFFKETLSDKYRDIQFKIIDNAKTLANNLLGLGYDVLTGGTDNHMVLVNVANFREGLTGIIAQKCLEDCGIIVNKNRLPYDKKNATVASGIRLGTPIVTKNRMGAEQMDIISALIDSVLREVKIIASRCVRHSILEYLIVVSGTCKSLTQPCFAGIQALISYPSLPP